MYHSVVSYVCVDSSYRSLSEGLLLICHEDRYSPGREPWALVSAKSRACRSWWQEEGLEVSFSLVCNIRYLFWLEIHSCHDSFCPQPSYIAFPYDMVKIRYFSYFEVCIIV